jgi:hypothetical protein
LNDELERVWKEAVVDFLTYCPSICLEGLKKTTKNLRIGLLRAEV